MPFFFFRLLKCPFFGATDVFCPEVGMGKGSPGNGYGWYHIFLNLILTYICLLQSVF